jgi:IS5 family transposase
LRSQRKDGAVGEAERARNRNKSKVRVRVEHVFAVVKRLWGFTTQSFEPDR